MTRATGASLDDGPSQIPFPTPPPCLPIRLTSISSNGTYRIATTDTALIYPMAVRTMDETGVDRDVTAELVTEIIMLPAGDDGWNAEDPVAAHWETLKRKTSSDRLGKSRNDDHSQLSLSYEADAPFAASSM